MNSTTNHSGHKQTYVIDAENELEMARLLHQDRILTQHMGGLFPERSDIHGIHDILDIACGPGGWALQVAQAYPEINVIGIDISLRMIQYAQTQAFIQEENNSHFIQMDVLKPLDFPDNSFDLVNARLLLGFMSPATWPKLLQECIRILRSGGSIRLSETEYSISNSLACEELGYLFTKALYLAGQSFSPDGRHIGLTPMLGRLLRETGYQNINYQAYAIDGSAGTEAYDSVYQDMQIILKLIQPFLIKMGVATQEELNNIYQQAMKEMQSPEFTSIGYGLTVWGEKP